MPAPIHGEYRHTVILRAHDRRCNGCRAELSRVTGFHYHASSSTLWCLECAGTVPWRWEVLTRPDGYLGVGMRFPDGSFRWHPRGAFRQGMHGAAEAFAARLETTGSAVA